LKKFPKKYSEILNNYFPIYKKLPNNIKKNLHACILVFIKEKEFIGVKGINIDDEKRVLIAANACLLTSGIDECMYKDVKTIIIYPYTFIKKKKLNLGGIISESEEVLLGEAWQSGQVVISWKDLIDGDLNPQDGRNVGFHEFAHQLDMNDGVADGTPSIPFTLYHKWSEVMSKEFKKLKETYKNHKKAILDYYAITNEAEFFAVATEVFFEKPQKLKEIEPDIYDILKEFYRLDPAKWV